MRFYVRTSRRTAVSTGGGGFFVLAFLGLMALGLVIEFAAIIAVIVAGVLVGAAVAAIASRITHRRKP